MDVSSTRTCCAIALLALASTALVNAQTAGIQRVEWLQGCWSMVEGDRAIDEQWMAPRGSSMVGMGRTVRNGRVTEFELVLLREDGDRLVYEAHPSGQESASFVSTTVSDSTVVFENPQHDFPQKVGYRREGSDALLAWIEGSAGGRQRRVEFAYRRAACPAAK